MVELQNFIDKMRATSSSTDKVQIIKDADPFIHNFYFILLSNAFICLHLPSCALHLPGQLQ